MQEKPTQASPRPSQGRSLVPSHEEDSMTCFDIGEDYATPDGTGGYDEDAPGRP